MGQIQMPILKVVFAHPLILSGSPLIEYMVGLELTAVYPWDLPKSFYSGKKNHPHSL